jgi:hypothetical protein
MTRAHFHAVCLAAVVLSTPAAAQRSSRRVVRAPDIAAGGWHRLGDVVSALMPGTMASVDGFNAALTNDRLPFAGLSAAGSPQWLIRIDGQRIPVAIDGMWILDALPVAMTQVDSVTVMSGSSIVDGYASLLGTIDIYTRRPVAGVSGVGDYQHGDESGDPGPYRYTPLATPNVEKLGPFASGAVAYRKGGWSLDGAARYSSLNITDTNITRRFPTTFSDLQSDVNASGGSGVLSTSLFGGHQYTLGGRGRFTGLMWVPSQSHHESLHIITTTAGTSGDVRIGGASVRYGATGTSLRLNELRSPLSLTVDRDRVMYDVFGELALPGSVGAVGAGATSWSLTPRNPSSKSESRTSGRVWVDVFPTSSSHGLTASLAAGDGDVAPSFLWWISTAVSRDFAMAIQASTLRRLAVADGVWPSAAHVTPSDSAIARNVRFDELRLELADTALAGFTPSIDVRLLNTPNWRLDPRLETAEEKLQMLILGAGVETKPGARTHAALRGEIAEANTASPAMGTAVKSTPAASLQAELSRVVMTNFRLSAAGRLATATSWPPQSANEMSDLPALKRIDVSANKPFWHDRVRAQVVIRNLLASDERYHPAGASWNFRTHLALTIALPPYGPSVNSR